MTVVLQICVTLTDVISTLILYSLTRAIDTLSLFSYHARCYVFSCIKSDVTIHVTLSDKLRIVKKSKCRDKPFNTNSYRDALL